MRALRTLTPERRVGDVDAAAGRRLVTAGADLANGPVYLARTPSGKPAPRTVLPTTEQVTEHLRGAATARCWAFAERRIPPRARRVFR